MAVGTLSPAPWFTVLDSSGNPVSGALISTFLAGTSTPVATYTDVALSIPNANPVVCDSAGRCVMFLSPGGSYKFVVTTAGGASIRTQDNIGSIPGSSSGVDVIGTAGENLLANDCVYQSDGSGAKTAGRWYKADATNAYSSTLPLVGFAQAAVVAAATFSVRLQGQLTGFSGLTPGAYYYVATVPGTITATAPGNARFVGQADSATVLNVNPMAGGGALDILQIRSFM